MALMRTYKDVFQALKRNEPVIVNKFDRRELIMAHIIASAGLATYTTVENGLHGLLPIKPKKEVPTVEKGDLIRVSFWYNDEIHAGERFGKRAGGVYKVVSRDGKWIKYEMMSGVIHTIDIRHVEKALA